MSNIKVSDIGEWSDYRGYYMIFKFKPHLKGEKLKFAKQWRRKFNKRAMAKNRNLRQLEREGFEFLLDPEYPQFSHRPTTSQMRFYRKRHPDQILKVAPYWSEGYSPAVENRFDEKHRNSDGSYNLLPQETLFWIYGRPTPKPNPKQYQESKLRRK